MSDIKALTHDKAKWKVKVTFPTLSRQNQARKAAGRGEDPATISLFLSELYCEACRAEAEKDTKPLIQSAQLIRLTRALGQNAGIPALDYSRGSVEWLPVQGDFPCHNDAAPKPARKRA